MNDLAHGQNPNRSGGQLVPAAQSLPSPVDAYGLPAGYGAAFAEAPEPLQVKLLEIWRILNKRKWIIFGIAASLVAVNAIRTLMQTPMYTATVRLQIEREAKIIEGGDVTPNAPDYEFWQTQLQLLRSRMMALRVAPWSREADDPGNRNS
jgi:succinoglycan biosynthesis transport protein ExoP